jgi:hypothetical protein
VSEDTTRRRPIFSAIVRYIGPVPTKDAPKLRRLRFTRMLGVKLVLPFLPIVVFAMIEIDQTWAYAVFTIWAIIWLATLANLSLAVRRLR